MTSPERPGDAAAAGDVTAAGDIAGAGDVAPDGSPRLARPGDVAAPADVVEAVVPGPEAPVADEPGQVGATVLRGGGIRLVSFAATVLLSVGGAALLLRHLGTARAGRYFEAVAVITIVQGFTDAGLTALGLRESALVEGEQRAKLLRALLGLRLMLTAVGVVLAIVFALSVGYPSVVIAGVALAGAGLLAQNVQITLATALQADLRQGVAAAADVLRQAVLLACFVGFTLAGAGVAWFLAATIPAALASWALTARAVRGQGLNRPSLGQRELGGMLREALPYAIAVVVNVVYFRVALIALSLVANDTEVGSFGAAFRVIEVLIMVPGVIGTVAFPVLTRRAHDPESEDMYVAVLGMVQGAAALGGLIAVIVAVGAPVIIDVVAGPQYHESAGILRIQGFAVLATLSGTPWAFTLLALRKAVALMWISLAALVIGGGMAVWLADTHGAHGAAIATVIGECVIAIGAGATLTRMAPRLRPPVLPFVRIAVAGLPAVGLALIPGLPALPATVAATLAYVVVFVLIGGLPGPARDMLRGVLRRPAVER